MTIGKPCRFTRCHRIVEKGNYCEEHAGEEQTHGFERKTKERNPLYKTKHWKKLRAYKLSINPICEKCNRVAANTVHHVKSAREYPDLALDIENLEALCASCHNRESQSESQNSRRIRATF